MPLIMLTGPKHAGKSSVGRALAALYHAQFVDLDELVAEQSGKSPRELYTEGPSVFQQAETVALASLLAAQHHDGLRVAAAGGGLIDNAEAWALATDAATARRVIIVSLDVSSQTAWERIRAEPSLPPFLNTATPAATHRALHERRAAAYRRGAQLTVAAEERSAPAIAQAIAAAIAAIAPPERTVTHVASTSSATEGRSALTGRLATKPVEPVAEPVEVTAPPERTVMHAASTSSATEGPSVATGCTGSTIAALQGI
ncbi:MAG: shikimate kinase [Treponema sp.]|jgi:shikimate kinase|nr:shikimate kinase [Treponema sp.]